MLSQKSCWSKKMFFQKDLSPKWFGQKIFGKKKLRNQKIWVKMFGQDQVSNSCDIPDLGKCHKDKCCTDKCHRDS